MAGESDDPLESSAVSRDYFFDGEGTTEDDLGKSNIVNKEGWYHFEITGVEEKLDTMNDKGKDISPKVQVELTVLETVDKQCPAGTKHYHSIWVGAKGGAAASEGSKKSAFRFGIGAQVLELKQDGETSKVVIAGTNDSRIPLSIWKKMIGKHVIAQIVFKPAEGEFKEGYEIPFGRVYAPNDPYVESTPKNIAALEAVGYKGCSPGSRAKGNPGQASGSARNEKKADKPADKPAASAYNTADL